MQAVIKYDEMCYCRNFWMAAECEALANFQHVRAENIRVRLVSVNSALVGLYAKRTQELRLVNLSSDTGEYTHDPRD